MSAMEMEGASIGIDGPFSFTIKLPLNRHRAGRTYVLTLDGGEWRCSGLQAPWIAQGRVDRYEALARALRDIEKERSTA